MCGIVRDIAKNIVERSERKFNRLQRIHHIGHRSIMVCSEMMCM